MQRTCASHENHFLQVPSNVHLPGLIFFANYSMFLPRLSCRETPLSHIHTDVSIMSIKVSNPSRHETKEVFPQPRKRSVRKVVLLPTKVYSNFSPLSFNNRNIHRPNIRIGGSIYQTSVKLPETPNNGTDVYGAMLHVSAKSTLGTLLAMTRRITH